MNDGVDLTKLLGGGGVGIVLLTAVWYFLRHLERRDERDEKRYTAFLTVTQAAVDAISRIDARAGIVVDAIKGLSGQVLEVHDQLDRVENKLDASGRRGPSCPD